MDTLEKAKPAIAEPELSDLERDKLRLTELLAELEAANAELKSAEQAIADCLNQRLPQLRAYRDTAGQKRDRVLEEFADQRERLRKRGVACG